MVKNGDERGYARRGRGRQGRGSQMGGPTVEIREKLREKLRAQTEKTEGEIEVKAKITDKEMDIMISDGEEQKEEGTESDENEEQESTERKEESTKNKGERVKVTERKISGLDIYSSDDSFTDDSFNNDESENQKMGKVSANEESLTSPKGRSKRVKMCGKEGKTGRREGTNNLLDEFDSETSEQSVSSNESSWGEQMESGNENDMDVELDVEGNIGKDEKLKERTKKTKMKIKDKASGRKIQTTLHLDKKITKKTVEEKGIKKGVEEEAKRPERKERGKVKENKETREQNVKGSKKGVKGKDEKKEGKCKGTEKQIREAREYQANIINNSEERNNKTSKIGGKRIHFQSESTTRSEYSYSRTKGILKTSKPPSWEYTTRCDVKVKVLQDDEGDATIALRDALRSLLGILVETGDPNTAILPWKEADEVTNKPITDSKELTTKISQLKKYFGGNLRQSKEVHDQYASVRIVHNKTFDEINEDISYTLKDKDYGLYKCSLQKEEVSTVGWLLYSIQFMETERLKQIISDALGGTELGLRWRMIYKEKGKVPNDEKVFALHVEVETKLKHQIFTKLGGLLASPNSTFRPDGVKLRFVPEYFMCRNAQVRGGVAILRNKQKKFNSLLKKDLVYSIENIDFKSKDEQLTVREAVMSLKANNHKDLQLFHAVQAGFRDGSYNFTFIPEFEEEAMVTIDSLLPILIGKVGEYMANSFTYTAQEEAQTAIWNPKTGKVESEADQYVAFAMEGDSEFEFAQPDDISSDEKDNGSDSRKRNIRRTLYGGEGDDMTVKTLQDLENPSSPSKKVKLKSTEPCRKEDDISQVTMDSPQVNLSQLEKEFVKLQRQNAILIVEAKKRKQTTKKRTLKKGNSSSDESSNTTGASDNDITSSGGE